ncbi:unnamed protein product [Aureobasidium vineae]|uniref:Pentatricopeptide repeat protein n=1 Tax=Aureobasidium vineae TaxID=2773715 RepID=A0A9N8JFH8_9PEZI|nr:unnamed protein product [Aureobasidium vineae]
MFQSRRRVPSEGALRVLRQLAYISSGTACGAAAIVAEERRRQTNLVSKIAENSRRLKQHPRHQHTHAAQRRRADHAARPIATSTSAGDPLPDDKLLSLPDDKPLPQAETFRNDLLPSEVERGYAKLNSHQPPHEGKSQPTHNPQPIQQPTKPKDRRRDFDVSFFTTDLKAHGPTSAVASFNDRCNELIDQGQNTKAFGLLRAANHHLRVEGIPSAALHPFATRLFDSNLAAQNYRLCSKLLYHMDQQGWPITHCVHSLALACIEPIRPTTLILLKEKYGDRIPLPHSTYPALCAAYSTYSPELCAMLFAKHLRQENRLSVLPLCESAWPAIIDHMWSVTHNYNLVDSLFIRMCELTDHPPLALYNAMIHVCIKHGRIDRAHHHLRTIQQSKHLQPDVVTFGHFVFKAASDADWPPVEDLMAMLVRAGETEAPPEKRTDLFVPVLKAYAKRHHPEEVWGFAFKAIDEYGVLPDPRILSTGLGNLIRIGRLGMIPPWVNKMRTYGQGAEIAPGIALAMMRQFYFDTRPSYTIMVWLCRRLMNNVPEYWSSGVLNLLREAVAYDLRGYRAGQAHRIPHAMHMLRMLQEVRLESPSLPKPLYWNQLQQLADQDQARVPSSDSNLQDAVKKEVQTKDEPEDLQDTVLSDDESSMDDLLDTALSAAKFKKSSNEHEMLMALSEGRYTDVLNLYESSLGQSGLPASSYSLEMAMQARTKLPDDAGALDDGALGDYIDMASEAGMDTITALLPLLNHQVQNSAIGSRMHVDELCDTVRSFYENMVKNSVTVRHHLATSAATVLLQNGKPNDAIRLLSQIYLSPWAEKVPLDLPAMTVLLQAYIHVRHSLGIEWVIKEVLEKDYRIDYPFMTVIRKAKISAKSRASVGGEKGMNNLRLSRMLEYYANVCRAKQMAQIKGASRLGNRLVNAMIKLARPASTDAPWQQQAKRHGIDPMMWSGRGSMWRVYYIGGFRRRRRGRRRPNFAKY